MSAPTFALLLGFAYVALGIAGGYLGLAGGLVSGLHFALGLWGLFAWSGALGSLAYARAMAVICLVLAIAGLPPLAAFESLQGPWVWVHFISALAAAWIGWRSFARRKTAHAERRHGLPNRRRAAHPVALERRRGNFDRRQSRFGGTTLAAG